MILKFNFLFLSIFITFFLFAQPVKKSTPLLNFKKEVLSQPDTKTTLQAFSYTDKGAITEGLYRSAGTKTLYLPAGIYTLTKNIFLYKSGLHIAGAGIGKTIVRFTSDLEHDAALFQSNGASDITIEGITFTGNAKKIKAVLEFNSQPNKCKNIRIINCEFVNLWVDAALNFGGASRGETHSNDNVLIDHCRFYNIYNPTYPVVTNDTDPKCVGINLQQTTLRANIQYCQFENISGDGIFGWGWSLDDQKINLNYGNWTIHHCQFQHCWMGIEVNGGGLGSYLNIHDNILKYATHNGGFLISVDSYKAKITNNKLYDVDRSLIEFTSVEGEIKNNTGFVTTYRSQSGAVIPSEKYPDQACLNLYGYNNTIANNHFTIDPTKPDAFSPSNFNAIKLIGKTTDIASQPLSYKGISDYSAYWTIDGNTFTGFTRKIIDATNGKIRNVVVTNNVFKSSFIKHTPVEVYGYNWSFQKNTFDFTGAKPDNNTNIISVFYLQKDRTILSSVNNKIVGTDWTAIKEKYIDNK